jgi:predicted nucleic-acid-binding Zn-ribbon protein
MAGLFYNVDSKATEEEKMRIAQTGEVPSHLKNVEDKQYYVILRQCGNGNYQNTSSLSEDLMVDGEVIIETGRKNVFKRIEEYLCVDASMFDGNSISTSLKKSVVMVEGVDAGKAISLYRFLQLCIQKYPNDTNLNQEFIDMEANAETDIANEATEDKVKEESYDLCSAIASGFGSAGTYLNKEEN